MSIPTARTIYFGGISLGTSLAINISWYKNKSIPYACVHGICSWSYVCYFSLKHPKVIDRAAREGLDYR